MRNLFAGRGGGGVELVLLFGFPLSRVGVIYIRPTAGRWFREPPHKKLLFFFFLGGERGWISPAHTRLFIILVSSLVRYYIITEPVERAKRCGKNRMRNLLGRSR